MSMFEREIKYVVSAETADSEEGLKRVAARMDAAGTAAARGAAQARALGASGQASARQMQMLSVQLTDVATQLAGGQNPFLILLQQGGQLKDQMGGVRNVFAALSNVFTLGRVAAFGAAAGVGALALAAFQGYSETAKLEKQFALTGGAAGLTRGKVDALVASLAKLEGVSQGGAKDALTALMATGSFSASNLQEAARAVLAVQRLSGEGADELAKKFAALRGNVTQGAVELNRQYSFLNAEQVRTLRSLEAAGKGSEALKLVMGQLADTMQTRAAPAVGYLERAWEGLGKAASATWQAMLGLGKPETLEEQLAKVERDLKFIESGRSSARADPLKQQRDDLRRSIALQNQAAAEARLNAERNQKEIERQSDSFQSAEVAKNRAVAQLLAANEMAALEKRQYVVERAYELFAISAQEYRTKIIGIERARIAEEEGLARYELQIASRERGGGEQGQLARAVAMADAQTKIVKIAERKARLDAEIARGKYDPKPREGEGLNAEQRFRDSERRARAESEKAITEQLQFEQAARDKRLESSRRYAEDLVELNQQLGITLIQDDEQRGRAVINTEEAQMRKRLDLEVRNAEDRRAIEDELARWRLQREQQLTEELKPEWQRRLEEYGKVDELLRKGRNGLMDRTTQGAEDAFVDLIANGKASAKQLVAIFNEELARIAWRRYLAKPAAEFLGKLVGVVLGGDSSGAGGSGGSSSGGGGDDGGYTGAAFFPGGGAPDIRAALAGAPAGGQVVQHITYQVPAGMTPGAYAQALSANNAALKADIAADMARPGRLLNRLAKGSA